MAPDNHKHITYKDLALHLMKMGVDHLASYLANLNQEYMAIIENLENSLEGKEETK